ncbi:hypothetical protein NQ095_08430 [Rossellomorea sp. SC111]|uniref:hypothetical protein n=1 Tax=Rossellomorea sp. SC111 TaxID=2968985 RepID=UPI00215B6BDE|nr:hypothetical protein [Rossellomorea sp. SC111]MCR8848425.1 hypothetical protein [Rossellomorea sp. SC111]
MRIIILESKKAIASPIIFGLLLLFLAWNVFYIIDNNEVPEELGVVNKIVNTYGTEITEDSLKELNQEIVKDLEGLNAITQKKSGESYEHAGELFSDLNNGEQPFYTDEELQFFNTIYLEELYLNRAQSMDQAYSKFNIKKMGEKQINGFQLSGDAANMVKNGFEAFESRFEELKENGEYNEWFFEGKQFAMHGLLFKKVFRHIIIESMILVVLSTALITNFEFENGTGLVTFTTRRGRRLMIDKLKASLMASSLITLLLLSVTLGAYFIKFDYSQLWYSSINSGFNWETQFPYVSWWDFSFIIYLTLAVIVSYTCMLLFTVLTFNLSIMLKNSYFTIIAFSVFFISMIILQGFVPGSSVFKVLAGFNLSILVLNPHQWWMATGGLTMFKYYEVQTLIVWAVVLAISCYGSMKKIMKEEIT